MNFWPQRVKNSTLSAKHLKFEFAKNFKLSWVSQVAQQVKNPLQQEMQETWVWSLGQEDPLKQGMATHPRRLVGFGPWGFKESDTIKVTEHISLITLVTEY